MFHEVGHVLGLGHSNIEDSVMDLNAPINETFTPYRLKLDDLQGIQVGTIKEGDSRTSRNAVNLMPLTFADVVWEEAPGAMKKHLDLLQQNPRTTVTTSTRTNCTLLFYLNEPSWNPIQQ